MYELTVNNIFLKDEEIVVSIPINIGMFYADEFFPDAIIRAVNQYDEYSKRDDNDLTQVDWSNIDFDSIVAYDVKVTRDNMSKWKQDKLTLDELVETVEKIPSNHD